MTRVYDETMLPTDTLSGDAKRGRKRAYDLTIDPELYEAHNHTGMRSQRPRNTQPENQNVARRGPGSLPTSRGDFRILKSQHFEPSPPPSPLGYPDPGLIHHDGFSRRAYQPNPVLKSQAAPEARAESQAKEKTEVRRAKSSKKRTSAEAGLLSGDVEDDPEDATFESQKSTRRSKRAKTSLKQNDAGDEVEKKRRKISKLNIKIAQGKGPKKGSLGPKGEVRTREDGRMEFRDIDNPDWTLAKYHNDLRRELLDEAAKQGEFDHPPVRGEAADDETSFQLEQKSWGPSRVDWQTIVDSEGRKVMFEVDRPEHRRPLQEPEIWIHQDMVLLDSRNHPIKDWPGLNKTLSTEMESWRWEALMRTHPWLTVADLLARMPHTREKRGKVLPLQTPQAFTNRAYRFRVPNQIPASNQKNGSKIYREEILKNLASHNAKTTEDLPTLNRSQLKKVRKANEGKFMGNSRYVVKKDDGSEQAPPQSRKRKVYSEDDDAECETDPEYESPAPKRSCTRTVQDAYVGGADLYSEPTDTPRPWDHPEQQEPSVPLFATIEDQGLAFVEDENFTSPHAVIEARRNGNQQTRQIGVYWYRGNIPRHVGDDGNVVEDVVHSAFYDDIEAVEPIPGDDVPNNTPVDTPLYSSHFDPIIINNNENNNDGEALFAPLTNMPLPDPFFAPPGHNGYPYFPTQRPNAPPTPAFLDSQIQMSYPNQIGRYQTQSDLFEEPWRTGYGNQGF